MDMTIVVIRRRQSRYDIFENIHVLDPFHFELEFAAATECLLVTMTCRRTTLPASVNDAPLNMSRSS